jgi:haloacid dehalogenase superfamily, subfamily IA, variant 3 with third motif having DD or ED
MNSFQSFGAIFDMDGVIIDSNPFHKIALRQFCAKYGYNLSDDELRNRIYGRTNKDWIANLFERKLSAEELHHYGEEKESLFRELYKNDIKAVAGLESFLIKLQKLNIPTAIGTSAPRSNVGFVLAKTGLEKYFSVILDESHVTVGKPNPEIYIKVADRLGLPPQQCLVFEDSLSGVESAQKAGARVLGISTTHSAQELSHTDFVAPDFNDLDPAILFKTIFKIG